MCGSAMFTTVRSKMIISWAPRTSARLMPRRAGRAGAGKGAVDRVAEEVDTRFLPDFDAVGEPACDDVRESALGVVDVYRPQRPVGRSADFGAQCVILWVIVGESAFGVVGESESS